MGAPPFTFFIRSQKTRVERKRTAGQSKMKHLHCGFELCSTELSCMIDALPPTSTSLTIRDFDLTDTVCSEIHRKCFQSLPRLSDRVCFLIAINVPGRLHTLSCDTCAGGYYSHDAFDAWLDKLWGGETRPYCGKESAGSDAKRRTPHPLNAPFIAPLTMPRIQPKVKPATRDKPWSKRIDWKNVFADLEILLEREGQGRKKREERTGDQQRLHLCC